MLFRSALLTLAAAASLAHAWGKDGHQMTGNIAQALLSADKMAIVNDLLPDFQDNLAAAAVWADTVKFTKGFAYTRTLHYSDAQDHPPKDCNYDYERDCPGGKCLTGAIANFTTQLSCKTPKAQRGIAVKFLMHFLGDLTQPLHTCERLRGGNDAKVVFDGKDTVRKKGDMNLHGVWDYSILEKRVKLAYGGSMKRAFDAYLKRAESAQRDPKLQSWTACLGAKKSTPLACAIEWVKDSNAINCEVVWKAFDENPKQDFGERYYEAAWPVVEQQIIKAGVRAAAWFDANLRACTKDE